MKISTLSAILHALNHANVKFLIVGGVAVNLHGYQRMTADLDLVIQLNTANLTKALSVFQDFGYKPMVPVDLLDATDENKRSEWISGKNMTVLQLWSDKYSDTSIDIFIKEPFDFDSEYSKATAIFLDQDLSIKLISLDTLISMKKTVGRDRDNDDIHHLEMIRKNEE